MDEESIWMLAFLVSLHNSSSYDDAEIQAGMASDVADSAVACWRRRFDNDQPDLWGDLDD